MIIDTTTAVSVILAEPEAERMAAALLKRRGAMDVNHYVAVESRLKYAGGDKDRLILDALRVRPLPLDLAQLHEAIRDRRRYGKQAAIRQH